MVISVEQYVDGHLVVTRDLMAHCRDTWLDGHMVAQVQEKVVEIKRWRLWLRWSSLNSELPLTSCFSPPAPMGKTDRPMLQVRNPVSGVCAHRHPCLVECHVEC
jgi:hypothetical protein